MSAAALLLKLQDAGVTVRAEGAELVVLAPEEVLTPLLVAELRDRKGHLLAVLAGDACRWCEAPLDWRRPGGVTFADGTAAHLGCYVETEAARARRGPARRGRRGRDRRRRRAGRARSGG